MILIWAQHVFVCRRFLRRPSGKRPHVPPALITHWELVDPGEEVWRGRGLAAEFLLCAAVVGPAFVSDFTSVDVAGRGRVRSLALKTSRVAKMSSHLFSRVPAGTMRAWRDGLSPCHSTQWLQMHAGPVPAMREGFSRWNASTFHFPLRQECTISPLDPNSGSAAEQPEAAKRPVEYGCGDRQGDGPI
ncbi:hypothetical protein QQF64_001817 [Cirrhinus molitorella]|uniref:Uncharacterized protein n=1 Tax=Cirrhinus molitorella TaxID=172907 RepID=A0ABR3MNE5_9TELE